MHRLISTSLSCGVKELIELHHPPLELVRHVAYNRLHQGQRFSTVLFSDSERHGNGNKLAAFITKNKLGVLKKTAKHCNPNSGRDIRVFMWHITCPERLQKYVPKTSQPSWGQSDSVHSVPVTFG